MEDDTKNFLLLIAQTISSVLLWMLTNMLFGIYYKYGFISGQHVLKNIIYYTLSIASFVLLLRYFIRRWKL